MNNIIKITWIPTLLVLLFLVHQLIGPTPSKRIPTIKQLAKGSAGSSFSPSTLPGLTTDNDRLFGPRVRLN